VSRPESVDGLLDGRLGLAAVGDVCFHDQRCAARLVDLGGERFQPVLAAGHQGDGRAVFGELAGGGSADTAARAGDEGDGAGKFRSHGTFPFLSVEGLLEGFPGGRHVSSRLGRRRGSALPVAGTARRFR
jgi:hypothetical protein